MKITTIIFAYNELPYLPYWKTYYLNQGCGLYVIDNMSTDGTWEWLQDNNIPSHRFDTEGAFQLEWLMAELKNTLDKIKPDWFVIAGIDMYHIFTNRISEVIKKADLCGYNQIKCRYIFPFKNTGEPFYRDMRKVFFYAEKKNPSNVCLISKYVKDLTIKGDMVELPFSTILHSGAILEYGMCKPKEVNEEKYQRRKKAWDLYGTPKGHGIHYMKGREVNWKWDKERLIDVRKHEQGKVYLNLLLNEKL